MAGAADKIYTLNSFNADFLRDIKMVSRRGKGRSRYLDIVGAFDIETTTMKNIKQSVMYIWQMQLGPDHTIIGRYWYEFKGLLEYLETCIPYGCRIIIYVHNLSYEFQFLKSIINFTDVFAMDNRKVLTAVCGSFEFRCSYLLSNMSLQKFVISAGGEFRKISGYDYTAERYPWTELTDNELKYCIYDVKALESAVRNKMYRDGDTLVTIPRTSTGYVRRIFKEIMRPYSRMVKWELPDLIIFQGLRKAFRGGNTHANRYASSMIINDVYSYDISSSYPSVMISEKYPGRFEEADPERLAEYLDRGMACLIHMNLYELHLINDAWGCPYLAKAKCGRLFRPAADNGRILSAEAVYDVWFTEVDLQIMTEEYQFKYEIIDLYVSKKKRLPHEFRAQLIELYKSKTELKGIDDYEYSKAKNQFNSAYGMSVQNPCKPHYKFIDGLIDIDESETLQDLIEEYQRSGWLPYQIGVWVTSYARQKLEAGLNAIEPERFVYADTDSVKVIGCADDAFDRLNRQYRDIRYSAADPAGNIHFLGIYEKDGYYPRFITLGAKKYAYEDESGKLHVTVSGVNKNIGAEELEKLENFRTGFVFKKAGGMEAVYNDFPSGLYVTDGIHKVDITSNVALLPSTYTLGISPEYSQLINFLMNSDIRISLHYER